MAARSWLTVACLCCFMHRCVPFQFGLFDDILGGTGACQDVCSNSYPLHTYEKGVNLEYYCQRGCRLFTIVHFVHDDDNLNQTRDSCALSCKEAYPDTDDENACIVGCNSQVRFTQQRKDQLKQMESDMEHNLYPLLYVHNMYSNMVDKLWRHMRVSWSFYMQADNGRLVVVKSPPQYYTEYNIIQDTEDSIDDADYKTSNYLETNLAALDNSATPNLKHSQMHALEHNTDDMNLPMRDDVHLDWLGCIARKTGMPRLLLSFVIFCSAMVMIWLCFTTAVTAPEHRVTSQKLSIYGDLDYLKALDDQKILSVIHPQDKAEASALPIKIKVERI